MASIINSTDTGQGGLIATGDNSDELQLQTAETTAVTIDSSQSLLVGKTSADFGVTAGFEFNKISNAVYAARSGNPPLILNRLTSDGTIAEFRKDDTTVGAIGTTGGELYIDFGGSTGGAVSSRTLDDYEEGTFTVTYYGSSTAGSTSYAMFGRGATYTKIGRLVWVTLYMNVSSATGTGNLTIGGLPFTAGTTTYPPPITGSLLITGGSNWTSNIVSCGVYMSGASATTATIRYTAGATPGAQTTVTISNTATIAASFCYYAA